jgi:phosphoserine aminotransferase
MLDYRTHIDKGSAFNTPPVSAIFVVNRTLRWLDDLGGVQVIEEKNRMKADKLYVEIERNLLFKSPIAEEDRSPMNVPFVFAENGNEKEFLDFCAERGLMTLKGHRSVGGFRASIYNAMPEAGVDALVAAMREYESQRS